LTALGDAWEAADADAAAALFTVGATFQPTPFAELVRGRRGIHEYFLGSFARQPEASFSAQVLGAGDTYGIAHWRVSSRDHAVDGVFVCALDERGRCTSLRQWSHETSTSGDSFPPD
jgi:ketosteroid isomerase-like protein